MRRVLAILAVFHLVLAGCSFEQTTPTATEEPRVAADPGPTGPPSTATTDEPLVTFWVEDDSVNVTQYVLDSVAREVIFHLERVDPGRESQYYLMVVEETRDEYDLTLNSASLLDDQGELLAGIDYAWPANDPEPNWFSVTERTTEDEMTIRRETENGRVTEIFTLNGETRTYIYAEFLSNAAKTSPDSEGDGEPNHEIELPLPSTVAEELGEWEEFVSPENTLNYNQDGEFFVRVLTNKGFAAWVEQEFSIGALNKTAIDPQALCGIAGVVSLKCWIPPYLGNFICVAAAGVSLACSIGAVGTWLSSLF